MPTVAFWIGISGWWAAHRQLSIGRRSFVFACSLASTSLWILLGLAAIWRLAEHLGYDLEVPAVDFRAAIVSLFSTPGMPSDRFWLSLFMGTLCLAPWVVLRLRRNNRCGRASRGSVSWPLVTAIEKHDQPTSAGRHPE